MPLLEIRHAEVFGWLDLTFVPWLSRCTQRSERDFAEVRTCLGEIFNNIHDHSGSDAGCIFAQWYPKESELQIAVADFGCGIPAVVRSVEPDISDANALVRATEDGFSTKSNPRNRGIGLFFLIQNVVERFGGSLTLRSGSGAVRFENRNGSAISRRQSAPGFCPGTLLEISIRTDLIALVEEELEPFEW